MDELIEFADKIKRGMTVKFLEDAAKIGIPIIALCDTNNQSNKVDLVIPCNNKGKKSVGLVFYLVAREYLRKKGFLRSDQELEAKPEDFMEE